jgi:uncharacterized membrane protein YheB (UPF0754 family)
MADGSAAAPWLVLPAVGAAIGYFTNWLAVQMLFHPRRPRRILGITVQGLIPRRQADLAASVARTVEEELLSVEEIQSLVTRLAESERVRSLLHTRIDSLIEEQLRGFGPLVRAFVTQDLIDKLKARIEKEIVLFIEGLSGELHRGLGEHLDIHEMVRSRMIAFPLERLEEIVQRIAKRELSTIEWLGGVLGALIGLIEAAIVTLL